MSDPREDGFLNRWSERKRAKGAADVPDEEHAAALDDPAGEKSDEEILEEFGLPEPEALEAGDDFSGFMKGAVPARLRNRALRKLWLTNPVLANLDELLDYGEDFTDAATVVENLQTAYQVGRGFLTDVEEDAPEDTPGAAAPDDAAEDGAGAAHSPGDEPEPASAEERPDDPGAIAEPGGMDPAPPPAGPEPMPSPARRMRFRFDTS